MTDFKYDGGSNVRWSHPVEHWVWRFTCHAPSFSYENFIDEKPSQAIAEKILKVLSWAAFLTMIPLLEL